MQECDTLKEVVNEAVTDEQLANIKYKFPLQTPINKKNLLSLNF